MKALLACSMENRYVQTRCERRTGEEVEKGCLNYIYSGEPLTP
jgi:hypothetical protein